ncbi:uncharacterized protein PAC_19741 [Phialocephala subalpina]|uniref:Heterokaryon incompatibility domain-containing protein n=1 Tax=Phialocephala subalpina TaxID=576137 RepID=A0A1L7XXP2_9HELO|nr:uncharacterized protein PAC_19741 [Phialocephala subalpina]
MGSPQSGWSEESFSLTDDFISQSDTGLLYRAFKPEELVHNEESRSLSPCDHCVQLFVKAARLESVNVVQKLLQPDPKAALCLTEPFLEACLLASFRWDVHLIKILLRAVDDESFRLYSSTALESAVQNGQHEEIVRLSKAKEFLQKAHDYKIRFFHKAAESGDIEFAKLLVKSNVDVNADLDNHAVGRQSALAIAAAGGHLKMVEYLLSMGSKLNPPADPEAVRRRSYWDRSPLRAASEGSNLEVVEVLLREGADVNGDGALYAAASRGHLLIATRLLGAGADVNFAVDPHNGYRSSALQAAVQGGHIDMIEVLLDANAESSAGALHAACKQGFITIVKRLIDAGADVNSEGAEKTALQAACEVGRVDIVDLLLQSGASVKQPGNYLMSPLKLALKTGHLPVAERLMQAIEANSQDEALHFADALHIAVEKGYETIVKGLLDTGTPAIDKRNEHTLLVPSAAAKGYTSIVRLLLDAGASMDGAEGSNRWAWLQTALQAAVGGGHIETARFLLSAGANVNAALTSVAPPLHLAANNQSAEMVQLLLDEGANVHAVSYNGNTVYKIAERAGNISILHLLDAKVQENPPTQKYNPSLDVSTVVKRNLCKECAKISLEALYPRFAVWRPSFSYLIDSARNGCPFCMFFWKQLGITKISIPPSTVVNYNRAGSKRGTISFSLQEAYPADIEKPRSLGAAFCIGVEPFKEGPMPLPGNTSSTETVRQIQSWLQQYFQTHHTCRAHSDTKFLPTRLLNLTLWGKAQELRLVENKQLGTEIRYMALSHRWDANITASTSTTTANLALRLDSLPPTSLPLSFLQAAEVTKALGINYLWIDSLCIIQDSVIDWAHESSLMSQIYQNSYCTISVGATDDSSRGFFHQPGVDSNDSVEFLCPSDDGKSKLVRATKQQPDWQSLYEDSPLTTRGWIMQERELSPRIIHYTKSQVIWECRALRATEDWPAKDEIDNLSSKNKRLLDSTTTLSNHGIYNQWYNMVENYTSRQLTKAGDTLPALGGLARIVGEYSKSEYIGGLWADDLIQCLGWGCKYSGFDSFKGKDKFSRPNNYIAPTWSWASVIGPKSFNAVEKLQLHRRTKGLFPPDTHHEADGAMLIIKKFTFELATSDPYGQMKSASLHISAPMISGILGYDSSYNSGYGQQILLKDLSGHIIGQLHFDVPSERGLLQAVRCVPLFPDRNAPWLERGMGLALVSVEGKQSSYRRVGHV